MKTWPTPPTTSLNDQTLPFHDKNTLGGIGENVNKIQVKIIKIKKLPNAQGQINY